MSNFIIIRPGSTDFDDSRRIQGCLSIPLNKTGEDQTDELVASLIGQKIDLIFSPRGEPCLSTAKKLEQVLGVSVVLMDELENLNMGVWQGMTTQELHDHQPTVFREGKESPWNLCPPGGETLTEAMNRLKIAVKKMKKQKSADVIAVVLKEPIAGLFRYIITEQDDCDIDFWNSVDSLAQWEPIIMDNNVEQGT